MYQFFFKLCQLAVSVLFFLLISFGKTYSQDLKKVDSLKAILGSQSGKAKFEILYGLAYELFDVDNKQAVKYGEEAYKLSKELGDSLSIAKSGRITGQILRRVDRLNESIKILLEVLPISKRNKFSKEEKQVLNALAISYTFMAEYDKALEYHLQSLIIREKEGDKNEISITLNNIGLVYFKLKNYEQAIYYYKRSVEFLLKTKNTYDLDRRYINIGLCYNQIRDFEEAQIYLKKGFDVCKVNCQPQIKIEGNFGLGVSFFFQEKYDLALATLNESYHLAKADNNIRFQLDNLVYVARVYAKLKQADKANETLILAEKLAIGTEYNQLLLDIYREFSNFFNQNKNYEKASLYQEKYIQLNDSVFGGHMIKNIAKVQTNYAERENIKTIADKEEQIERQRSLGLAIAVIAILASLLIFVLYRGNRVKKKVNQALSEAKAIIEAQNKQLLSSNFNLDKELKEKNIELEKANASLLRVNEELDNFIYKTSHDIRGPLASLKGMCNVALMDVKDPLALNYLRKLDITAEKLNTILTRLLIVNQINNSTLGYDRIDFVGIVDDVLALERKKGLPARLSITKSINDSIEYYSDKEFVRIILENLIDNAIKFYNDSERIQPFVEITVCDEENHVKIKVVDNGIGISEVHPDKIFQMFSRASERSETGGIGLYITKTATEKLGGNVHLKTTPEGYTEFFVTLPLATSKVLV